MAPTSDRRAAGRACVLVALALAAAGCQREPEPVLVDIEGVVTGSDGKPLPNLRVVFYPDHETGTTGPESSGFTNAEGRYRVKTTKDSAGAVVGKHRVCMVDIANKNPEQSRIPPEHGSFSTTPLRNTEVKAGQQTLNFSVPRRAVRGR